MNMRNPNVGFHAIALTIILAATPSVAATKIPAYVENAVHSPNRPASELEADAYRMPAETLAFSGVKPGDKVLELLGLGGYYTHMLSLIVGPNGHVYSTIPTALADNPRFGAPVKAIAADPKFSNVSADVQAPNAPTAPTPVDVVWTSDNYHDMKNPGPFNGGDMVEFNKAVLAALKPGGIYIVIDHAAAKGTGSTQTSSLHRIDPQVVKDEVTKAGFVFVGESNALHRQNEDYTVHSSFKDEQFIFKFRKPR